ncbi:hypothetical protein BK120_22795 [Paenibacillus sp. FSL A5-0031]|nr:hypothetical protein BK120_22795 [Paenibacillus sp. FSL A5-0031]
MHLLRYKDGLPLYQQIKDIIMCLIANGEYLEGALLPSYRELSNLYHCSIITSKRVYQELGREGVVRSVAGRGTYVMIGYEQVIEKRRSILNQAFREAVELSIVNGCSTEEARNIFETILEEIKLEGDNTKT